MKNPFILPLILLLLVAFLGLAACSSTRCSIHTIPQLLPPPPDTKTFTIALMPFTDLSGQKDYDWLSIGIGEVLTTKLGNLPCFRLLERVKISEALKEMELGQTGLIDEATGPNRKRVSGLRTALKAAYLVGESPAPGIAYLTGWLYATQEEVTNPKRAGK